MPTTPRRPAPPLPDVSITFAVPAHAAPAFRVFCEELKNHAADQILSPGVFHTQQDRTRAWLGAAALLRAVARVIPPAREDAP